MLLVGKTDPQAFAWVITASATILVDPYIVSMLQQKLHFPFWESVKENKRDFFPLKVSEPIVQASRKLPSKT